MPQDDVKERKYNETVDPDLNCQTRTLTEEEKLEEALQESMDGSDPPSTTRPGDHGDPVPSSGFKEEEESDQSDKD